MEEYLVRFFAGGLAVSAFAALGDVFRPKSFAGLFGAAPSIALATLALTLSTRGADYAAAEGRAMIAGAVALGIYSALSCQLITRWHFGGLAATLIAGISWFVCAFGLYFVLLAGT